MATSTSSHQDTGDAVLSIPPLLSPRREGELAALVIREVIRQNYYPALRSSRYLLFMAKGRQAAWEAWRSTIHGFAGSMFQRPFIALAERLGLEAANPVLESFGRQFAESFEEGLDLRTTETTRRVPLDAQDQGRMFDWLRLLEETDDALAPILDQLYGPKKRSGLFGRPRWILPSTG